MNTLKLEDFIQMLISTLGRLPGWIAQWKEMIENKEPIGRPRQVYTGANKRDYVAIDNR